MKTISRARRAATLDLIRSAAAVSTLLACTGTYAQDGFPTRPIRLVVPYAPFSPINSRAYETKEPDVGR